MAQQDFDRHTHHTRNFFDADWNEQDFPTIYPRLIRPTPLRARSRQAQCATVAAVCAPAACRS